MQIAARQLGAALADTDEHWALERPTAKCRATPRRKQRSQRSRTIESDHNSIQAQEQAQRRALAFMPEVRCKRGAGP